ncbi:MAG: hypothetical protein HC894_25210 [Microcoleus sp. SM1_3_4]|nr:hypothetical protein [Microcoleus sp. SM1_3_4]
MPKQTSYLEKNMEISTFELLAKPIAPPVPGVPELNPVLRRVVQGYFLTISNLEAIDLRYRIEFKISLPVPPDPAKILLGNAQLIIDVEGANTFLALTQSPTDPSIYRGFFQNPRRQNSFHSTVTPAARYAQVRWIRSARICLAVCACPLLSAISRTGIATSQSVVESRNSGYFLA